MTKYDLTKPSVNLDRACWNMVRDGDGELVDDYRAARALLRERRRIVASWHYPSLLRGDPRQLIRWAELERVKFGSGTDELNRGRLTWEGQDNG